MATYRSISSTETDPQAPVTSALMKALDANPTAIAEAAAGAPRINARAIQNVHIVSGQTTGTTFLNVTADLSAVERMRIDFGCAGYTAATNAVEMGFSDDGGSTWGTTQILFTVVMGSSGHGTGMITVNLRTGSCASYLAYSGVLGSFAGFLTVPANVNAIRVRVNGATGTARWIFSVQEGRT